MIAFDHDSQLHNTQQIMPYNITEGTYYQNLFLLHSLLFSAKLCWRQLLRDTSHLPHVPHRSGPQIFLTSSAPSDVLLIEPDFLNRLLTFSLLLASLKLDTTT